MSLSKNSGIPKNPAHEKIDNVTLKICKDLNVKIQKEDLEGMHRVVQPSGPKRLAIILKLNSYGQFLHRARVNLLKRRHPGIFVNEDLTC